MNNYFQKPFTDESSEEYLNHLERRWVIESKVLKHEFDFPTFKEAIKFVDKVAELAEKEDHHPDIFIYYTKVVIEVTTHKAGGLTEKDFGLAEKIEKLAK